MTLAIIVACARNRVIGSNNTLPWHLPEDLRHFKAVTMGKPMIMGRKTYESIGRPLPGRTTLVVTRQRHWQAEGVVVCGSVDEAIVQAKQYLEPGNEEIMVVGGEQIYRQCLPGTDTIYLTEVALDVAGDAHFPELPPGEWVTCSRQPGYSAKADLAYAFVELRRR